jgi:hypothetical protein
MPLNKSERRDWTKYMMDYFVENGFSIRIYTTQGKIQFSVSNALGSGISISNNYGIVTISFSDTNLKNKFTEKVKINRLETILTEEEIKNSNIPEAFKKLEGINKRVKYTSVHFPCRIYMIERLEGISFYDNEEIRNSEEILIHRKMIFKQLLFFIEQIN